MLLWILLPPAQPGALQPNSDEGLNDPETDGSGATITSDSAEVMYRAAVARHSSVRESDSTDHGGHGHRGNGDDATSLQELQRPKFSLTLLGSNNVELEPAFGCCLGIGDNVRSTVPLQWAHEPDAATEIVLLIEDMDTAIDGRSWPTVLGLMTGIQPGRREMRSVYITAGFDLSGLWVRANPCPSGCTNWLWATHGGRNNIQFGDYYTPSRQMDTRLYHDILSAGQQRFVIASDVGKLTTRGSAEPTWLRASLVLRFYLYQHSSTNGCTCRVEARNPQTGSRSQLFSHHYTNRYSQGGQGEMYLLDLSTFANRKIDLSFVMESLGVNNRVDLCQIGSPELLRDGEVVYDFTKYWYTARLTVMIHGQERGMGSWDPTVNRTVIINGATGWSSSKSYVYMYGFTSGNWLPAATSSITFVPVWGDRSQMGGDSIATFPLSASLLQVPSRALNGPGLGGARAVGVQGSRAPCPLDGRMHRIKYSMYARRSMSELPFIVDHTSAADIHHYLNLDPDTLAIAEHVTNFTYRRERCRTMLSDGDVYGDASDGAQRVNVLT